MADPGRNGDRTDFKVVGRASLPSRESRHICSGRAKFDQDIIFPNQLFGKIMRSPYAHARIKSMDISKAKALPGVVDIITWEDPEIQSWGPIDYSKSLSWVATYENENALDNEVYKEGEVIGAVVCAETEEICDEAMKLIDIEWDVLPHVVDCAEADDPGAPLARPDLNPESNLWKEQIYEYGDIVAGFAEADHVVEFDFTFPQMDNYKPLMSITSYWEQSTARDEGESLYMTGWDMRRFVPDAPKTAFKLTYDKVRGLNKYSYSTY